MITVFWLEDSDNSEFTSHHKIFNNGPEHDICDALALCVQLTALDNVHCVTTAAQNPHHVGKMGVNGVVDGKLPDGSEYQWRKRRPY